MKKNRLALVALLATLMLALVFGSTALALSTSRPAGSDLEVTPAAYSTPEGFTAPAVRRYYGFDQLPFDGSGETIAIISAYDYTTAEADMARFIHTFGLKPLNGLPGTAACSVSTGPFPCFQRVKSPSANEYGALKVTANSNFAQESALDTQWAHAIAQGANILLVEAPTGHMPDMLLAVDTAVQMGATIVSMSWGQAESTVEVATANQHFEHPGVTFVAASGDRGTEVLFPASSPNVLAVGGTQANFGYNGKALSTESAWSNSVGGSVGGVSAYFDQPQFQSSVQSSGKRAVPDVSYAAANAGFATYYNTGWVNYGGTSAGAPQWAGLIALANQARIQHGMGRISGIEAIYQAAATPDQWMANFTDITQGTGACRTSDCAATAGFDLATGLGVPKADQLVWSLAGLTPYAGPLTTVCNSWDCALPLTSSATGEASSTKPSYYQFEAEPGAAYEISFAPHRDAKVEIYDGDQNLLTTMTAARYTTVTETWTAPSAGTYYIVIKAGRSAFYTLRLER